MSISMDKESCLRAIEKAAAKKVALVYHLTIRDSDGYDTWLGESKNGFGVKRLFRVKGSRKNNFAFLRVKAPVRQGAKAQTYHDISSFRNAAGRDHWPLKM